MADTSRAGTRFSIQRVDGRQPGDDVEVFLDRAWDDYRRAEGHDLSYDWIRTPVTYVARGQSGEILGVVSGNTSAGIGHLSELMVSHRYRGSGVGGELLATFEAHSRKAGCHKLVIHTDNDSPAHHFYRKRGWLDEAILRRDRGKRDCVRLCKFLDED